MKEVVEEKRVTLIAENGWDAELLYETPFDTLRKMYSIPIEKELALDYGIEIKKRVQVYDSDGRAYTVKSEK